MSEYRIFETDEFQRRLAKITPSRRKVIERKLVGYVYPQLRLTPCYGPNIRKLRDYVPETWRYRIGNYRIFYSVDAERHLVILFTVDDRKDAY